METAEDIVGTSRAAWLLKITGPRVRQLLGEGRVKGAYKERRFWRIPLYKGMPQIISGKRGPKALWYRRQSEAASNIYINKDQIRKNTLLKREEVNRREPVIIVEQGKRKEYGYEVEISGPCRVVYSPDRALHGVVDTLRSFIDADSWFTDSPSPDRPEPTKPEGKSRLRVSSGVPHRTERLL